MYNLNVLLAHKTVEPDLRFRIIQSLQPLLTSAQQLSESTFTFASIGWVAHRILSVDQPAILVGHTSRGAFLRAESGWIVFLSREPHRGPLTLNLHGAAHVLDHLDASVQADIRAGELFFPSADLHLATAQGQVWRPSRPASASSTYASRLERIRGVAGGLVAHKSSPGADAFMHSLLALAGREPAEEPVEDLRPVFNACRQALMEDREREAALSLQPLLGRGNGLTPSGDDVVAGFLLALNRWRGLFAPADGFYTLNQALVQAAYAHTTTLSANLIDCATIGGADERLIRALDYLVLGEGASIQPAEAVSGLLGWGNSSGADSLIGMALALTASHR